MAWRIGQVVVEGHELLALEVGGAPRPPPGQAVARVHTSTMGS